MYFEYDDGRGCLSEDISEIIYDKGSTAATLDNYRGLRFLEYTVSVSLQICIMLTSYRRLFLNIPKEVSLTRSTS